MTVRIRLNRWSLVAWIFAATLWSLSVAPAGFGQAAAPSVPAAPGQASAPSAWSELIRRSAAEYEMVRETADKKPLVLQPKPILRWANNTRLTEDGFTYLWIGQGRPEAVACIYSWGPDRIRFNFQSLSRSPLTAERSGRRVWYPAKPGVEFRVVPDASTPADSPAARLRQMKAIAETFTATGAPGFFNQAELHLRLLPREVYRYASQDPQILDGALFAFVDGTDPEVLLLLEAVRSGDGFQWQYALARRTESGLTVRYRDKPVWSVPSAPAARDPREPYMELEFPREP